METTRCHAGVIVQRFLRAGLDPSRAVAVLLATVLTLAVQVAPSVSPALAQQYTVPQAAAQINGITPKLTPQQTILVGTYDASPPGQFHWNLAEVAEYYPRNLPGYKQSEKSPEEARRKETERLDPQQPMAELGVAQPWHSTLITSLNVTYQFQVFNKPPQFSLTFSTPDANGQVVRKSATWSGNVASVTFNAGKNLRPQAVSFNISGRPVGGVVIRPLILPEIGAFVVPRLLIAIVYEPPGAKSKASYTMTSTAGTVMSFSTARTSGMVQTVDDKELTDTIAKIAKTFETIATIAGAMFYTKAGEATGRLGAVHTVFTEVVENTVMQKTVTSTRADSRSNGTFFSISTGAATDNTDTLRYPGAGDVFLVLEDVLFAWGFLDGKVVLAPKGYTRLHPLVSSQLEPFVPPILAQKFRELDPWFNPSKGSFTSTSARGTTTRGPEGPVVGENMSFRDYALMTRFKKFKTGVEAVVCPLHAEGINALKTGESVSSVTTQATTETLVTHVRGLWQTIAGSSDGLHSVTYSNSRETWQIDEQQTSVFLKCDDSDGPTFDVDLYLDPLFGTFFSVKGRPVGYLAGSVTDSQGRPLPNQPVTLQIGGQRYTVRSDQQGRFRFVSKSLPTGSGSIISGNTAWPVSYQGRPITNLQLAVSAGPTQGTRPTVGQPGIQPKPSSPGPGSMPQVASKPQPSDHCCTIASVDARSGVVTAQQVAGSQTLHFTAPQSLLPNLRVGQKVWVDSRTQGVSIEGAPNCCKLVVQPPAGTGAGAPTKTIPGAR